MADVMNISGNEFFAQGNASDEQSLPINSAPILMQYWYLIRTWRWLLVAIILLSLLGGLALTLMMTPLYTAKARIEISREDKNVTNVEGLESVQARRDDEFYQTQYELLGARSLAERIVRELALAGNPDFFRGHGVEIEGNAALTLGSDAAPVTAAQRSARERLAVGLLLENIGISPIARSSLIDLQYTTASPEMSKNIANAWAEQFIRASMDRRFESTADARQFLEKRLAELRERLEKSERDLVQYANNKGIVILAETSDSEGRTKAERTLLSDDLVAFNQELAKATADRVAAESRLDAQRSGGIGDIAINSATIATLNQRRADAAAEYAKLMVQFEPGYPAAKAVAQQIAAIDQSIAREENRVSRYASASFREAAQREQTLKARVDGLVSSLTDQASASIQYNIFQREVDSNRELYNALLQRYKEIGVAGIGANNIAIIDRAQQPSTPSSPKLPVNLAVALLVGLVLAGGAVFVLDQFQEGIRDPAQVPMLLRIPLIGSVPDLAFDEGDEAVTQLHDRKSHLWEAYLTIQTALSFATEHGVPKTIMVTSTRPAEGKSTTSVSLAAVLGRTGKRVLVIDADMRSPSLHEMFGLHNTQGLSHYLAGENTDSALLQETDFENVSLMPAGPRPLNAAELLSGDKMTALVAIMAERFDHVVIDSPPLLGLADAPLLVRVVEGVVFVIQSGGVPIRGLDNAINRLRQSNARIFGAILTKVSERNNTYGYGYGYGYGNGLSYGSANEKADD